jgi:CRP-like cAMP-binding protein
LPHAYRVVGGRLRHGRRGRWRWRRLRRFLRLLRTALELRATELRSLIRDTAVEGEWGGEGSLLKKEMRRYDLRALTPSNLCMVPLETFETLRRSSIEFNHFFCDIMNARMGEIVGMLEASRLRGPEMQVARALLMLADDQRAEAQEFSIPQHELALISGLSRQRVNIAINAFKNDK